MNKKFYAICLMTFMSGLMQASAPAASAAASSASALVLTQEQKNKAVTDVLCGPDSEQAAAEFTRLLNEGARYIPEYGWYGYMNKPHLVQALINHPSTITNSSLWNELQKNFITADISGLKRLMRNKRFDINYRIVDLTALGYVSHCSFESAYERVLFLRFMGIRECKSYITDTKSVLARVKREYRNSSAAGRVEHAMIMRNRRTEGRKVLEALEMPQHEIPTLLTPEQHKEYRALLLAREMDNQIGNQNVLTYLTNRQMHPSFAVHQKTIAQRRAQALAAAIQNEAQAAQNQLKKIHTIDTNDAEHASKKQKKDEEEKDN